MKKVFLLFAFALFSSSAVADWNAISELDDSTYYSESTSLRRHGNKSTMLFMVDLKDAKTLDKFEYLSGQHVIEFNCKSKEMRFNSFLFYSKNMAAGEIVGGTDKPSAWTPIPKNGIRNTMLTLACEYKAEGKGRFN